MNSTMKKYLIPVLTALLLGASCSKLDIAPRGEMNDKELAYKDPTIREQVLAGIYAYLYNEYTWGAFISIRMEAATDVAISRSTSAGEVANNSHTATTLNDTWRVLYAGINAANEFVELANRYVAEDETAEEAAQRLQQICEARFLRAYYYFTLVRMFGDVPFRTEPTSDLNNLDIARTPAPEIYHFIVQELNEIQALMANPNEVEYGHVANTAAQTALADVYLNLSGYLMKDRLPADSTQVLMHQRAAHWCRKVLENPAHDITKTDYITVFKNSVRQIPNLDEKIWELQTMYLRTTNGYNTDSRLGKYNGIGGVNTDEYAADAWIYQSATLLPLYGKISQEDIVSYNPEKPLEEWRDGKDQRATWNCTLFKMTNNTKHNAPDTTAVTTSPVNVFQFYPGKYRTIYANTAAECSSRSYSGARLPMYRIAEVHLMLAEALNEGYDDQAGAVEQLNIVRRRAHATEISGVPSREEVFDLIVDERARELCFEGKRRFDLVRWGLYEEKLMELEPLYREAYNGNLSATSQGWVRDKMGAFNNFNPEVHYIMPIPQAEISRNALIPQSEQNEGWGGSRKWK